MDAVLLRGLILACSLLWSDIFVVDAAQQIYQEVKAEVCQGTNFSVSKRLYQDVATANGYEQREISPWKVMDEMQLTVGVGRVWKRGGTVP